MKHMNQKNESIYPKEIIHRAKILDLVIKKKITQSQAAKEPGLRSTRQVRRLLRNAERGNYSLKSLINTVSGESGKEKTD